MFKWDATWKNWSTQVFATTAIGAQKAACRIWGKRAPAFSAVQVLIQRGPDGSPVTLTQLFTVEDIDDFEVTIRDQDRNVTHVHKQGDGKWKCQRCDRYRCEHVCFVQQSGVQLLPRVISPSNDIEILTY